MRKTIIIFFVCLLHIIAVGVFPATAQQEDIDFAPHMEYTVNLGPSNIVAADLNGDGHLDLAAACNGDFMNNAQNVSVLINHGNGTFEPHQEYPTDLGPLDIAAGDLNGDGDLDLVTANAVLLGDNTLSVLLNNGDGTFGTHVEYVSDTLPEAVAITDIDKDGDNDIICANNMGFSLSVLLNNGDGTFAPRIDYDNEYLSQDVTIADFDKDGYPDVATVNNNWAGDNYTLSVFLNYGNGTLAPYDFYSTGDSPNSLVTGDFDEDSWIDIAVSKFQGNNIDIFLNEGDGTFAPKILHELGHVADDLFAGDVDGDGHIDLVTIYLSGYTDQKVEIAFGWGNASFGNTKTYVTASSSSSVLAADLDGDGKKDLAISNGGDMFSAGTTVSILIQKELGGPNGNGDGTPGDGDDKDDKKGFFLEDPLVLIILGIVIIVVILSSVLVVRKKKKKTKELMPATPTAAYTAPVAPAPPAYPPVSPTPSPPAAPLVSVAPSVQPPAPVVTHATVPVASPVAVPSAPTWQQIKCPNCGTAFAVGTTRRPVKVECPNCHVRGTLP